jgi:hypothetical protein
MKMLFVIVCFPLSNGLLLNNGGMSTGNTMSDKHYLYVMDYLQYMWGGGGGNTSYLRSTNTNNLFIPRPN